MKKTICLLGAIIMLLSLFGCNVKSISKNQSKQNFEFYAEQLKIITENYNYSMNDITDSYEHWIESNEDEKDPSYTKDYIITIDEVSEISVFMQNSSKRESYTVTWSSSLNDESEMGQKIPLQLLTELVNTISGKEVTIDECKEFLDAPEKKYSLYEKSEDELLRKHKNLNFGEDWGIDYIVTKDLNESFGIGGLTKQIKK